MQQTSPVWKWLWNEGGKDLPPSEYEGDIAAFDNPGYTYPKDITIGIEPVQSGSGDPSPTNVRPISGWTGAKVANISDSEKQPYFAGLLNGTYGFVDLGTLEWQCNNSSAKIYRCYPPGISFAVSPPYENRQKGAICSSYSPSTNISISPSMDNKSWLRSGNEFFVRDTSYESVEAFKAAMSGVQLVYELATPATPTITSEQYNQFLASFNLGGWLIPISWQSVAGTVYGGTLDVTTGLLTVTMAEVDLGTLEWRYNHSSAKIHVCYPPGISFAVSPPYENRQKGAICSSYSPSTNISISPSMDNKSWLRSGNEFFVRDTSYESVEAFKSAMSGVQLVYELATPQTYQLTPTEVTLLLGVNNVWADTGETTVALESPGHMHLETRATIGGTAYSDISAPVITRALMQDRLSVGNVVSASLALAVRGAVNIPRSAAVVVEVRLNDGQAASEWLPQGTFYISRRMRDPVTGLLALECYDALLKANAVWTPSAGAWPRTMAAVTAELAALLGVTLDSRTVIPTGAAYAMSEPAEGTTIRDALGVVAQAAGGNWVMTPAGLLRLVRVGESGGTVDVTGVVGGIDVGQAGTVTGVRSTVDGVVTLIGDDTGIVVDVSIAPMIAAEMAEDLIGQAYAPFHLSGAIYDPAAELGDGVRAGAGGEVISALCSEQAAYGPAFRGDIAAPDPGEVTDEYPYIGSAERTLALAKATATEAVDRLDDALTQQEIFNRLTDDGAAQGLLLYNGQLYINASYINTGYLNVGRINFNEPDRYYDVPNENDPDSLLSGQTVVDGWIVNASGTGEITVFSCGFAIPLRGKTITVTFAYKDNSLSGGTDSWSFISSTAQQYGGQNIWNTPSTTVPNPYTYTVTVPDDAMSFRMSMDCTGVKQINVSLDSPIVPSDSIEYNYEGQRIGERDPFHVYRDGTLITWAKSIFRGAARFSQIYLDSPLDVDGGGTGATTAAQARANLGITPANIGAVSTSAVIDVPHGGTGATTAAQARANLGVTPANIGAVAKSGDTINGNLIINGNLTVNAEGNIGLTSDYGVTIGDTDAKIVKLTDGTVYMQSSGDASVYVTDDGDTEMRSDGGAASIILKSDGDINVTGSVSLIGSIDSSLTVNDRLTLNGDLTVNADNNINLTSDYEVAIGDTDAKIVKHSDGTVHMQSSGDASVYVTNGGNAEIRSDSGAASIILTPNGDVNVSGDVALDAPLPVTSGGTGANNKPDAISNLFDVGTNDPSQYPDKPGIYRVISNIFANLAPASHYGTLVIFQSVYGLHTFLDVYGNLYYGFSGDTFGEPITWHKGVTDGDVIDVAHGGTGATTPAGARANLGLNDIGPTQAQSAITPVNDDQLHQINVIADCWVCASFHVTANVDGYVGLLRNGVPVINNVHSSGSCNYWANAQFPCKAGGLLQYRLNSNAADSRIYFLTV